MKFDGVKVVHFDVQVFDIKFSAHAGVISKFKGTLLSWRLKDRKIKKYGTMSQSGREAKK